MCVASYLSVQHTICVRSTCTTRTATPCRKSSDIDCVLLVHSFQQYYDSVAEKHCTAS